MTVIPKFLVSQEWAYQARNHEINSTFIITKIDEIESKGSIIHIYIKGLKMKNSLSPNGFVDHIVHLPCSEDALLASKPKFLRTIEMLPNYQEGYLSWLKSFESGKSGVFRLPLSESITFIENMFLKKSF